MSKLTKQDVVILILALTVCVLGIYVFTTGRGYL